MRIVTTADVHFGSSDSLGRINQHTGLHTRLEDFLRSFDTIIDYTLDPKNEVDLFVIAGDIFKTRHPTNTQLAQFAKRLRRLQEANKQTLIVVGNHDILVGEGQAHTVEVIKELGLDNITIIDKPTLHSFPELDIVAMPYIYRQRLNLKTNQETLQYYQQQINELHAQAKSGHTMFVGHQSIEGLVLSAGYVNLENLSEILVPQSYLKAFDFCILGHIHHYQVVNSNPEIVYTGPLERLDFSQADKPVGFVVYDSKTNEHEFIELEVTDLYKIEVDLTECKGDLTEEVLSKVDQTRLKDSIVSLKIKIKETDISSLNTIAIQSALDAARYKAGLKMDVEKTHTVRDSGVNESLSASEALARYIETRDGLEDIADEMKRIGLQIVTVSDAKSN